MTNSGLGDVQIIILGYDIVCPLTTELHSISKHSFRWHWSVPTHFIETLLDTTPEYILTIR